MTYRSFFPRVCASSGFVATPTDANVAAATATTMADLSLLKSVPPMCSRARARETLIYYQSMKRSQARPHELDDLHYLGTSIEVDGDLLTGKRRFLAEVGGHEG